jgi:hypothetical protein
MRQTKETIMFTTLKTAALAGLIGLMAMPAMADSLYLGFGDRQDDTRFGVYLGDNSRTVHRRDRYDDNGYDRYDRYDNRRDFRRAERRCTPERALDKAERIGIRRARIDYVNRETIGVIGRSHGDRVSVTFARDRGCPIIG